MNGWVLIQPGGADPDSPYRVNVNSNSPVVDTVRCGVPCAGFVMPFSTIRTWWPAGID